MKFSLIVCTYMRPKPLLSLLNSVKTQSLYPNEILIIDGSTNTETETILEENHFDALRYFKVEEQNRGLTKQRNFGIEKVSEASEIICFLDDDIELTNTYFEELISTYSIKQDALAVGGYITNEVEWEILDSNCKKDMFCYDGWTRSESFRFKIRRILGLLPNTEPCILPMFSHGRSVSFLPPTGKTYKAEQIMGGVSSYRKEVFSKIKFSHYFEGYSLYEDVDFSLRLSKIGKLYVNTKAQLYHYHETTGRPNYYYYGKMVLRNGWYVWRLKNPKPSLIHRYKWNAISILLIFIRFINIFSSKERMKALNDFCGRVVGWFSLFFNKPKIEY